MEQLGLERQVLETTFELADVGMKPVGQKCGNRVRQQDLMHGGLAFQDTFARRQVGLVDDGQKTRAEPRDELAVKAGQILGQKRARENEPATPGIEGLEGIEQLVLDAGFVPEKVDVLQQQHVHVLAKRGLEPLHLLGLERHDQPVGEFLGRQVGHTQPLAGLAGQIPPHGLDEMGLAQARGRADKQLVGRQGTFADALGSDIRQLVARSDHEFVVAEAKTRTRRIRRLGRGRQGQGPGRDHRSGSGFTPRPGGGGLCRFCRRLRRTGLRSPPRSGGNP